MGGLASCRDFACIWGYVTSAPFLVALIVLAILLAVFRLVIGEPIANRVKPFVEWNWQNLRRLLGLPLTSDLALDLKRSELLSQERPLLQRIALEQYARVAASSSSSSSASPLFTEITGVRHAIPLLDIPHGIPNSLFPLSAIKLEWRTDAKNPAPVTRGLSQQLRSELNKYIENNITYRLLSIGVNQTSAPVLSMAAGTYEDYIETCEALNWELTNSAAWYYENRIGGPISDVGQKSSEMIAGAQEIFAISPNRRKSDPLALDSRSSALGVSVLTVLAGPSPVFLLHKRGRPRAGGVPQDAKRLPAEALGTVHVVPAGTFQPIIGGDRDHRNEFDINQTIIREFAEELLGCEIPHDLAVSTAGVSDILEMPQYEPIRRTEAFFASGNGKTFFLGIGLDTLTLKPELMALCVINAKAFAKCFHEQKYQVLSSTYEGRPITETFSRDILRKYVTEQTEHRLLAAAAGCLALTERHWATVENEVRALSN